MKLPIILQKSNSISMDMKKETIKHLTNKVTNSSKIFKEPFFKPKIRIER